MPNNALEVINLTYQIDGRTILNDISFSIGQNQAVHLNGVSGSGKSTLAQIIAGLITPTSGSIKIMDTLVNNPVSLIPPHKRNLALHFQDQALWPHLNCYEHIAFVTDKEVDVIKADANELAIKFDLTPTLLTKHPNQLSGGEQQRLALMRTIMSNRPIIIFDEPFTGLDPSLRETIASEINSLRTKATILLISHEEIPAVLPCDLTFTIQSGQIT